MLKFSNWCWTVNVYVLNIFLYCFIKYCFYIVLNNHIRFFFILCNSPKWFGSQTRNYSRYIYTVERIVVIKPICKHMNTIKNASCSGRSVCKQTWGNVKSQFITQSQAVHKLYRSPCATFPLCSDFLISSISSFIFSSDQLIRDFLSFVKR